MELMNKEALERYISALESAMETNQVCNWIPVQICAGILERLMMSSP